MWSAMSVLLGKIAFGGNASLQPADPSSTLELVPQKKSEVERSGEQGG